jgi:DNA-binding winged helix-turn-helix (wHTH) protein
MTALRWRCHRARWCSAIAFVPHVDMPCLTHRPERVVWRLSHASLRCFVIYGFGDFEFDDERQRLCRAGSVLRLPRRVSRLLNFFVHHAGRVITRDQLIEHVWKGKVTSYNNVTATITHLRKILRGADGEPEYLETLYGAGYRFIGAMRIARVVAPAPSEASVLTSGVRPLDPPVAHERVIARLERALECAARGHGRICALMGTPNVGATCVVDEFVQRVTDSVAQVSWTVCPSMRETPLSIWRSLIRGLDESIVQTRFEGTISDVGAVLTANDGHAPMDAYALHESFEYFMRAVARTATARPRLLIIEDIHLADAASLGQLGAVVEELARARLMIIATLPLTRDHLAPRRDTCLPYLLGHRNCDRVFIEPELDVGGHADVPFEEASARGPVLTAWRA